MSKHHLDDLSHLSMLELFRVEVENQTAVLTNGLLALERDPEATQHLEALMRAAHSLKGAARIVNLPVAVRLAHAMEDCFVAAQDGKVHLGQTQFDMLLGGVDLLQRMAKRSEADIAVWETDHAAEINDFLAATTALTASLSSSSPPPVQASRSAPARPAAVGKAQPAHGEVSTPAAANKVVEDRPAATVVGKPDDADRVLRLTAEGLNRLLGLAGESLVAARWLHPFAESMRRLRLLQGDLGQTLNRLRQSLEEYDLSEGAEMHVNELFARFAECRVFLDGRMEELELFDYRSAHLAHRLYLEVLQCRMRPFGDGVRRFPRMVRDLARSLGKEVKLEIIGEETQVDRDILDKLETPLAHLLRNAVDHGCERPEARRRAGKPAEGTIRLEARHSAGMLSITVADDGAGVNPQRIREVVTQKKLISPQVAERLNETELLEFLFLPGFTMKNTVTEVSGRGVGLDVVQNMVKSVRGAIRAQTVPGKGMRFQLQLPLTLSVIRALLVEIADEPYAIPLAQIVHTLKLPREKIEALEGRHHFTYDDQRIGLVTAHQVLDSGEPKPADDRFPVVVLGDRTGRYGLVVDRFLGERELVVQPLDPRLGKVKDISAAALMEDGSPVLIVDAEDMVRSIEKLVAQGLLTCVSREAADVPARRRRRVLAVDDSLTVRELERKLLTSRGYLADVAVDGMDGWNAVRTGHYDLVITDVDMPRLDGIELATLIKKDPQLKALPVMIVSYKDHEEDRIRGLEAGADYYLTKGSFHDETLLQAVADLIGEPES